MKLNRRCDSCDEVIKLEYDETECTPEYCPFCGEELNMDEGDYEPDVAIPHDDWDN